MRESNGNNHAIYVGCERLVVAACSAERNCCKQRRSNTRTHPSTLRKNRHCAARKKLGWCERAKTFWTITELTRRRVGLYVVRTQEGRPCPYPSFPLRVDLQLRPIYHHKDDRIRAHVFLCMLSYYVEWHMRERLRKVLFDDCDRTSAKASRSSPVAPATRSETAKQKDATRLTPDGYPVQSFQDLLRDLATLTRNRIRIPEFNAEYDKLTVPTACVSSA